MPTHDATAFSDLTARWTDVGCCWSNSKPGRYFRITSAVLNKLLLASAGCPHALTAQRTACRPGTVLHVLYHEVGLLGAVEHGQ